MIEVQPKLSSIEALDLCKRLMSKIEDLDYNRAIEHREYVRLHRTEMYEILSALEKLQERLQWGV